MFNEHFIVAVTFVVFIVLVYKPMKNAIIDALDQHTADAIKNLQISRQVFEEAQAMLTEIQKKYKEAEKNSKDIITKANEEAEAIMREATIEFENISNKKTQVALFRLAQQEQRIMEHLKESIIQRAIEEVNQTLLKQLDKTAQMKLIDDSIERIGKKVVN